MATSAGLGCASPRPAPRRPTTVVIVVNVLPLVFERDAANGGWTVEWNTTATSMFYRTLVGDSSQYEPLFVGCPEVFVAKEERAAVERQLESFRCVPVFLDPTVAHNYFQGFCKGMLWPIFHNVVDVYNSAPLTLDEMDGEQPRPAITRIDSSDRVQSCWCDPASWNPAAQDMCWADYCSVNRTFARRIVESYHDGDLIWVHDLYFLMLPSYLLRRLRSALVTLYLHAPFPSSEVFRCLAMRTEILRAMLCADHIGFLLFEHARHFLTTCKRMLGLNYKTSANGMLVMEYNGREIYVSCSHVEPDMTHLFRMMESHEEDRQALAFREGIERFIYTTDSDGTRRRKLVISSADRLEGLTGLALKLRAFDRFLALNPELRTSIVLVQIGLTLDSRPNDYKQTRDYVVRFTNDINRRWGTPEEPIVVFQEKAKTTSAERMQLWEMTDIYVDTCVRYGLWLFPFEFMTVKRWHDELDANRLDPSRHDVGVMIASEFTAYSCVLNGCLLVNPWKTEDLVDALTKATEMTSYEKQSRFRLSYSFLEGHSESRKWGERLLMDLEEIISKKTRAEEREVIEVGFGFDFRVVQFESGFEKLDIDNVIKRYSKSSRRLLIFDYGGTLSTTTSVFDGEAPVFRSRKSFENMAQFYGPPSSDGGNPVNMSTSVTMRQQVRYVDGQVRSPISRELREDLAELCRDPQNIVFVVSTGHRVEIEKEFGTIPNLNLVSDNGLFVKNNQRGWECVCESEVCSFDWKLEVKQVMLAYAGRTNGAFLVENEASLIYDYRNSDPEYGEIQSLELYAQLRSVVQKDEAIVYRGQGFVEVHQFGVSKRTMVTLILRILGEQVSLPDFIFYAGDDDSDEFTFRAIYDVVQDDIGADNVVTCTLGKKPSSAKFYMDSPAEICAAIHAVAVWVRLQRDRGVYSYRQSYRRRFDALDRLVPPDFIWSLALERWGNAAIEATDAVASVRSETALTSSQRRAGADSTVDWVTVGAAVAAGAGLGLLVAIRHPQLMQAIRRRLFSSN